MCGILGHYGPEQKQKQQLIYALESMRLRGPDKLQTLYDDFGVLCHARLAVRDLSVHGDQPMVSHNKRYRIVFNGEIYNSSDLKSAYLDKFRVTLKGHSDTEILLSCIEMVGLEKTLASADGMFACALTDLEKGKVYLFRDRYGEKPLYYRHDKLGHDFSFASTLDSLRILNQIAKYKENIDTKALRLYFDFGYIYGDACIVTGIKKLPAGAIGELDLSTYKMSFSSIPHFKCPIKSVTCLGINHTAESEFRTLFERSIENTLISDVPVGTFLSGGVDSTLVTAVASKILPSNNRLKTFSIGFYDDKFDESHYSNEAAERLGTEHHLKMFHDEEIMDFIPQISKNFCEPFADSSCLPTMMVSKLASEHVTVCLTGDGADELFGGYSRYGNANRLRKRLGQKRAFYKSALPFIKMYQTLLSISGSKNSKLSLKINKFCKLIEAEKAETFYLQFLSKHSDISSSCHEMFSTLTPHCSDHEFHSLMRDIDLRIYLEGDILTKVDRSAMAYSLETRAPFLNQELSLFAKNYAVEYNLKTGVNKYFPKKLLQDFFPVEFFDRPKQGFGVPLHRWLIGPLNCWMHDLILAGREFSTHNELEELLSMVSALERGNELLAPRIWTHLLYLDWMLRRDEE